MGQINGVAREGTYHNQVTRQIFNQLDTQVQPKLSTTKTRNKQIFQGKFKITDFQPVILSLDKFTYFSRLRRAFVLPKLSTALLLPCYCPATALLLPCYCPATALLLPCYYPATALLLPCYYPATTLLPLCYCLLLPCCCPAAALLLPCYCPTTALLLLLPYCLRQSPVTPPDI